MFIPVNTVENNTFPLFIITVVKLVLKNAFSPILVIETGIVSEPTIPVQPLNPLAPIVITVLGIAIVVNPVQSLNDEAPILVIPSLIVAFVKLVLPLHALASIIPE